MAKSSGLGQALYVGGYDLSGDIGSISGARGSWTLLDVTGIDKSAPERIGGLRDGSIAFAAWYNVTAGQAHPVLKALPTADTQVMWVDAGAAIGSQAAAIVGKQIDYAGARAQDGSLAMSVDVQGSDGTGLSWCEMLTAGKRTDTTATNGTGLDYGAASTAFGMTAYLQVFSVTGTSVTVALQDAATEPTYAAITGGAFAAATPAGSPQTQRISTATGATIRQYVRVVTTGTFSNAVFAVAFIRHLTSTI